MHIFTPFVLTATLCLPASAAVLMPQTTKTLPEIRVTAPWALDPTSQAIEPPPWRSMLRADAAEALHHVPGAAISRNGPLTGQLQLRGVTADRVGIRVDGMLITPACPNHMDPPLHYALLEPQSQLALFPGCAPVSQGGDRIGGALTITSPDPSFAPKNSAPLLSGWLSSAWSGDHRATTLRSGVTTATDRVMLRYLGDASSGGNLRIPGGTVSASGYETTRHQLQSAFETPHGIWEIHTGLGFTRDAGTPALPMDMVRDDAWNLSLHHHQSQPSVSWSQTWFIHAIDHLMDNFSLRPVLPGSMRMTAPATSRDLGYLGSAVIDYRDHRWNFGVDLHQAEFDAAQVLTASGARRETFQNNQRGRIGTFADWQHDLRSDLTVRAGLRADLVRSDADPVSNQIMPTPVVTADLTSFNAADRSQSDWLPAAMTSLEFRPSREDSLSLAAALTSRAPSLIERYLWTPSNANAGLADGRTYLGNIGLQAETALEWSLTARHQADAWFAALSPFYRVVDEYILGLPMPGRLDPAGLPVLRYSNIDRADFVGFECVAGHELPGNFSLNTHLSYTAARNRDQGGALYRIAPLRGLVDFAWQEGRWDLHLECVWAAAQRRTATIQNEAATPGFACWNLRAGVGLSERIRLETGIENLFNQHYRDHLGGINRVGGGDLAIGSPIPSAARSGYLMLRCAF